MTFLCKEDWGKSLHVCWSGGKGLVKNQDRARPELTQPLLCLFSTGPQRANYPNMRLFDKKETNRRPVFKKWSPRRLRSPLEDKSPCPAYCYIDYLLPSYRNLTKTLSTSFICSPITYMQYA